MENVLLLNGNHLPLGVIGLRKALKLMFKGKVEVLEESELVVYASCTPIRVPRVLRLLYVVEKIFKQAVAYSRRLVFARDGHRCGYCGEKPGRLTLDHVLPRSRGGKTNFENTVACCSGCNSKKGDRTPSEAGLKLRVRLYAPTAMDIVRVRLAV